MFRQFYYALLLLACATSAVAAPLTGKTAIDSDPAAGISISVYPLDTRDFSGPAPYQFGPTAEDGLFSLDLPQGQYYLLAQGPDLFAYYGRNPLTVPKEGLEKVNLLMAPVRLSAPPDEVQLESGVAGTLSHKGKPLAGAVVMVYPDLSAQLKGFGLGMSVPSDDSGYFEVPLSAGTYYLVVRARQNGLLAGPLRAGDFFGYYPGNPLVIKETEVKRIGIGLVEVPQKVSQLADKMFGQTSVRGRILNAVGSPVAGVRVLLYTDDMMLNRPLYVSQPSNAKGEYVLSFPKGGTYFLAARDKLGGAPGPGELYGRYPGSQDGSIQIKAGQSLSGIDLLVEEMW